MKITNATVDKLFNALCGLDGAMVNGAANVFVLSPPTRIKIARNLRRLRRDRLDYMTMRNKLVMEYSEGTGKIDPKHPKWFEFASKMAELDFVEIEVDLTKLKIEELDLEKNQIPSTVLANLDELLDLN